MTYTALPSTLHVGQRIACPKHYENPQIITVAKVYDDGRLLLVREDGNRAFIPLNVATLEGFDYELVQDE